MLLNLFRLLFVGLIGYYIFKLVNAAFFSPKSVKRDDQDTTVRHRPESEMKSHIPDSEGDYIDYEELK